MISVDANTFLDVMEGGEVSFTASRHNTMRVIVWLALSQTRERRKRVRSPALDFDRKILKRFLEPLLTVQLSATNRDCAKTPCIDFIFPR